MMHENQKAQRCMHMCYFGILIYYKWLSILARTENVNIIFAFSFNIFCICFHEDGNMNFFQIRFSKALLK